MRPTVDIYGNQVDWTPTGRRAIGADGRMRLEMRKGETLAWMFCRPRENCTECAAWRTHG